MNETACSWLDDASRPTSPPIARKSIKSCPRKVVSRMLHETQRLQWHSKRIGRDWEGGVLITRLKKSGFLGSSP